MADRIINPNDLDDHTNYGPDLMHEDPDGGLGIEGIEKVAQQEEELYQLKVEQGIIDPEKEAKKPLRKMVSYFFDGMEKKTRVNKKKYILLACFLGIFGAHRFYSKKYKSAVVYLLLCWAGISICHTVIDLMIIIPMQPDEDGCVEI